MARYTREQLAVVYVTALVLLGIALWSRLAPGPFAVSPAARRTHAYELSGAVSAPGVYRFDRPQSLGQLLAAAGVHLPQLSSAQLAATVANGSRVTVDGGITVEPMRAQDRLNCSLPLSLKASTAEDLALIPGMGLKTAEAIIRYRDSAGGIRDSAELGNIEGIGEKKLERFRAFLTVQD